MKMDLTRTNGSSPPSDFLTKVHHPSGSLPADTPSVRFHGMLAVDEILTVEDLAGWLKLKPRQIYELTRQRGQVRSECPLPVLRFHSKALRFRRSDVEAWLDKLAARGRTIQ